MGTIVRPHAYSDGAVARPDHANKNETTLYNLVNGNIDWDNIKAALVNAANGILKLDASGKVPLAQLPTTIPSGVIVMWSGTLGTIPTGWSLCDGTGGTPDLRDKFIYGWTDGVDPGGTGGATTHTHTYSDLPEHTHTLSPNPHKHVYHEDYQGTIYGGNPHPHGADFNRNQDTSEVTLTIANAGVASPETDAGSSLPPYFKLAFIIKD